MTKKHYEAIAFLVQATNHDKHKSIDLLCYNLAEYFATDNPRFNRERFLTACGIEIKPS